MIWLFILIIFLHSRPLTSTTPSSSDASIISSFPTTAHPVTTVTYTTTPIPLLLNAKSISDKKLSAIPLATLRVTMETTASTESQDNDDINRSEEHEQNSEDPSAQLNDIDDNENVAIHEESITPNESEERTIDEDIYDQSHNESEEISEKVEETTSVEQRLKKISEEIEKFSNNESEIHGRQSFFSLSDLIKTLRPSDKKIIPQIDSDYSNTMHVLGETIVGGDDARKIKTVDLRQTNRALY